MCEMDQMTFISKHKKKRGEKSMCMYVTRLSHSSFAVPAVIVSHSISKLIHKFLMEIRDSSYPLGARRQECGTEM